jgi:hypothetical protein
MRTPSLLLPLVPVLVGVCCLGMPTDTSGCAAISSNGRPENYVRIAEETAIIVWHAPTKTQHFIRRATFNTRAPDFGFLVPTPTKPVLAEADNAAFTSLEEVIRPREVTVSGGVSFEPVFCWFTSLFKMSANLDTAAAPPAVRVLDSQRVGGLDAVVLEADDAQALGDWLKERGYPSDPELVAWLAPYVSGHWKITAFKIAPDPSAGAKVRTSAVRMSFQADGPFFPYREPKEKEDKLNIRPWEGPRLLRVFFVSAARVTGKRGTANWSAQVPWADLLDDDQRERLARQTGVPAEHIGPGTWLTTFEDTSSPRPGTDEVFFDDEAPLQTAVRPPDIIRQGKPIWIPVDVVVVLAVMAALVAWGVILQRRRARPAPAGQ